MTERVESDGPFPAFIGGDFSFDEYEAIAFDHIASKIRATEAELYAKKWFDYRRLHPTQATYLFVHHYNEAYGAFHREAVDRKLAFVKAIKGGDVFRQNGGKGHLNRVAFWKLRQKADLLGIRYDFFCRAAMRNFIDDGWLNAPRPCHVDDESVSLGILDKWQQECKTRLQFAKHPFYKVENFTGHPDQLTYEAFIVQAIKARQTKHYALSSALYEHRAIRFETALRNFNEDVIERAISASPKC